MKCAKIAVLQNDGYGTPEQFRHIPTIPVTLSHANPTSVKDPYAHQQKMVKLEKV